jgi:hypothetical protein
LQQLVPDVENNIEGLPNRQAFFVFRFRASAFRAPLPFAVKPASNARHGAPRQARHLRRSQPTTSPLRSIDLYSEQICLSVVAVFSANIARRRIWRPAMAAPQ